MKDKEAEQTKDARRSVKGGLVEGKENMGRLAEKRLQLHIDERIKQSRRIECVRI